MVGGVIRRVPLEPVAIERPAELPAGLTLLHRERTYTIVRAMGTDAAAPVILEERCLTDIGERRLDVQLCLMSRDSVARLMRRPSGAA